MVWSLIRRELLLDRLVLFLALFLIRLLLGLVLLGSLGRELGEVDFYLREVFRGHIGRQVDRLAGLLDDYPVLRGGPRVALEAYRGGGPDPSSVPTISDASAQMDPL